MSFKERKMGETVALIEVCDACGSDLCWQGLALCGKSRNAGVKSVPACQNKCDRTGRQCARPAQAHTSGWSHAFDSGGPVQARRKVAPVDPLAPLLLRTVELLRRVLCLAADPQSNPAVTDQGNLYEDVEALRKELEGLCAKSGSK